MTTIQAHLVGHMALIDRGDLDRLLELARRSEEVRLETAEDDLPTITQMRLAEQGGAFDFWKEPAEDIYSLQDGEPI